jgi:polyphosphate kinase
MSALSQPHRPAWAQHSRYVNREYSWLQFNSRVLAEAANRANPLLERLKFLAIFESNLDEFFMVRVSGLIEQAETGVTEVTPDGLSPSQQLAMISETVRPMRARAGELWELELKPSLHRAGIHIVPFETVGERARRDLTDFFQRSVFPLCTPLQLEPATTFPFISGLSLNMAVELDDEGTPRLARVKIPTNVPRLVPVPGEASTYILLEDLVAGHLHLLFPGVKVLDHHMFRVIRDADIEIRELEAADLISAIEQTLRLRRYGDPVLLECEDSLDDQWVLTLRRGLGLAETDVMRVKGLVGFDVLWEVARFDRPGLKFAPHVPVLHERLAHHETLLAEVAQSDVLLHHPYDSFRTVEEFVASSALDPKVVGIKMTLYRVGSESPIVETLLQAAEAGKQVAVMVELKARFDESNNLGWARALERAGVHITFGFAEMKVHCKLCLLVRQESGGIRQYAHIGTGNYNPSTARIYTDLGLMTTDPAVCQDIGELFNYLTGFSRQSSYRKLLVAPLNLREAVLDKIQREIEACRATGHGQILFKLNSLVDPEVIDALYEASQAGVEVLLAVRGICCLRPRVRKLSENIKVVSIVGRFLEHSRIYHFENGGSPETFIGSADMMRRNLDRRIEVLVPVQDPRMVAYLRDTVLLPHFRDNQNAWELLPTGLYRRIRPAKDEPPFSLQQYLTAHPASALLPSCQASA